MSRSMQNTVPDYPDFVQYQPIAVGIIISNNKILIAKRHALSHQGGKWEFPGGKIEKDETVLQALARELYEELDITPTSVQHKITIPFHYQAPKQSVKVILKVYLVASFTGEAKGKEGQEIRWVSAEELHLYKFPKANKAIIKAIELPSIYYISDDFNKHSATNQLNQLFKQTPGLFQCRSSVNNQSMSELELILNGANENAFKVQLNSSFYLELLNSNQTELSNLIEKFITQGNRLGIHLTGKDLHRFESLDLSLFNGYISASCHQLDDIFMANHFSLDFIVISPINKTQSHPNATAIGWKEFSRLCLAAQMPVYALGGMNKDDLNTAINYGAQGISGISLAGL
ncbi:MAG: Nudix family hydrolase [Gammaproteobacteria bacterium]|nr:Nudix family hydrolase [Gammaproteobacteria bacterium]